jgi:hypothetical protein
VLRDSHWIGGDPVRGEVYGWAAWAPGQATLALRNPTDRPARFEFDLGAALELPAREANTWQATPVYAKGDTQRWRVGQTIVVALQPFEVRVWDLSPAGAAAR